MQQCHSESGLLLSQYAKYAYSLAGVIKSTTVNIKIGTALPFFMLWKLLSQMSSTLIIMLFEKRAMFTAPNWTWVKRAKNEFTNKKCVWLVKFSLVHCAILEVHPTCFDPIL